MLYFFILVCLQIILESFPVSSSGHMVFLEHVINYISCGNIYITGNKVLSHFLHGPTVVVLAIFFFDKWFFLIKNFKRCWVYVLKIIGLVCIADMVTFFLYLIFNCSRFAHSLQCFPVGIGFVVSLLFLLTLKYCRREKVAFLTWKKALFIGFFQGIALLPGVSRFGLTFVAGCWVGLSARRSFEFSFAIQWPLIFAGFLSSVLKIYLCKCNALPVNIFNFYTLLIILLSSIVAFFGLKVAQFMALTNKLWYFAVFLSFSFILWIIFVYIIL
ncbi:undecaprenyl-diphosphate phosphatase [Candidatus Dependentiae bacterium]